MKKHLKKTTCKACGCKTMVGRTNESEQFKRPDSCPNCRSLGVEKAIEQRLMCKRKTYKGIFQIADGKELLKHEKKKQMSIPFN